MDVCGKKPAFGIALIALAATLLMTRDSSGGDRIFRCESGGKVTYSDRGCGENAEQAEIEPGPLNSFSPESSAKSRASADATSAASKKAAPRKARDGSIAIEQQRAQQKCQRLADRLTTIEVKLRRGYTVDQGERLREQRRQIEQQRRTERCR